MSETTLSAQIFSSNVIDEVRNNLVTEKEVERVLTYQMVPNTSHLIKLLTDPHSSAMVDRHEKYVRRLCRYMNSRGGVLLSELVEFFQVINLTANKIEESEKYGEFLTDMVKLIGGALLKSKTSDEQKYEKIAIDSLEKLALLLRVPFINLRKSVIHSIFSFWEQRPADSGLRKLNNGLVRDKSAVHRSCSKDFHEMVIENSKVVSTMIQATPLLEQSDRLLSLKVVEQLTRSSVKNANILVNTEGAKLVALMLADAEKLNTPMLIDILWNSMENATEKDKLVAQLSELTSITSICKSFSGLMKFSHSKAEKETRNDLLALITQIARGNPHAPFVETNFLREIIAFGCSNDRNLTNCEIDFEFLRMLLTCIVIIGENKAALGYIKETEFLKYLMLPIRELDDKTIIRTRSLYQWSNSQKEELQLLCLQLLTKIAPRITDTFIELNGIQLLMGFLFWSFQTDYGGQGNSILGTGGRGSARAQCRFALRCIRSLCTPLKNPFLEDEGTEEVESEEIKPVQKIDTKEGMKSNADEDSKTQDQNSTNMAKELMVIEGFLREGIVDLLLLTLSNVNNINVPQGQQCVYIEDDLVDLEIQEDMMVILSLVADVYQKELASTVLIDILIFYLRELPGKVVNGIRREQLLLSVLDCILNAVLGYEEAEIKFLELEGAFLLIDLLDQLPQEVHGVVLSCLIELTENPRSMTHLMTWRSSKVKRGQSTITLAQLLIKLWKQQETRMGCFRGDRGELTNLQYPMAGQKQIQESKKLGTGTSAALSEVSENIRAKIYCLMSRIGFNDQLPGVETEDYVTLALIEKYYDFKVSEVWNEVIDELHYENIKLIDADCEAAETIKQAQSERARGIQNLQDQLKEAKMMQDKQEEQILFEKIREKYRQGSRMIQRWYEYIERTSNYSKLQQAKKHMTKQIYQSKVRSRNTKKSIHHNTRSELNTTTFQGRRIYIESTPSAITRINDPDC